jgi:sialate O-acetylesterase
VFHPATAQIEGAELLVRSEAVAEPRHVRYAWHEKAMPNLATMRGGLPVAPFHSQKWPLPVPGR